MYSTAEAELEAFKNLDQPDLFYEFYPETYPSRNGMLSTPLEISELLTKHVYMDNEPWNILCSSVDWLIRKAELANSPSLTLKQPLGWSKSGHG